MFSRQPVLLLLFIGALLCSFPLSAQEYRQPSHGQLMDALESALKTVEIDDEVMLPSAIETPRDLERWQPTFKNPFDAIEMVDKHLFWLKILSLRRNMGIRDHLSYADYRAVISGAFNQGADPMSLVTPPLVPSFRMLNSQDADPVAQEIFEIKETYAAIMSLNILDLIPELRRSQPLTNAAIRSIYIAYRLFDKGRTDIWEEDIAREEEQIRDERPSTSEMRQKMIAEKKPLELWKAVHRFLIQEYQNNELRGDHFHEWVVRTAKVSVLFRFGLLYQLSQGDIAGQIRTLQELYKQLLNEISLKIAGYYPRVGLAIEQLNETLEHFLLDQEPAALFAQREQSYLHFQLLQPLTARFLVPARHQKIVLEPNVAFFRVAQGNHDFGLLGIHIMFDTTARYLVIIQMPDLSEMLTLRLITTLQTVADANNLDGGVAIPRGIVARSQSGWSKSAFQHVKPIIDTTFLGAHILSAEKRSLNRPHTVSARGRHFWARATHALRANTPFVPSYVVLRKLSPTEGHLPTDDARGIARDFTDLFVSTELEQARLIDDDKIKLLLELLDQSGLTSSDGSASIIDDLETVYRILFDEKVERYLDNLGATKKEAYIKKLIDIFYAFPVAILKANGIDDVFLRIIKRELGIAYDVANPGERRRLGSVPWEQSLAFSALHEAIRTHSRIPVRIRCMYTLINLWAPAVLDSVRDIAQGDEPVKIKREAIRLIGLNSDDFFADKKRLELVRDTAIRTGNKKVEKQATAAIELLIRKATAQYLADFNREEPPYPGLRVAVSLKEVAKQLNRGKGARTLLNIELLALSEKLATDFCTIMEAPASAGENRSPKLALLTAAQRIDLHDNVTFDFLTETVLKEIEWFEDRATSFTSIRRALYQGMKRFTK